MSLASTILGLTPIGYWQEADATGSTAAVDSSTNGNSLTNEISTGAISFGSPTIAGGTTSLAVSGGAYQKNPAAVGIGPLSTGTIVVFYNCSATLTYAPFLYLRPNNNGGGPDGIFGLLASSGGGDLGFNWLNSSSSYGQTSGLPMLVNTNALAACSVGASSTTIYSAPVGGTLSSSVLTFAATNTVVASTYLFTAKNVGGNNSYITGKVGHIAVFDYALTTSQIQSILTAAAATKIFPQPKTRRIA